MFIHFEVVEPFAENSWLIGCRQTGRAALIDPGGQVPELLARAAAEELVVEQILLTHAHIDHISGVAEAVDATSAPVSLHAQDLPLYEALEQQAQMFGLQARKPPAPEHELVPGCEIRIGDLHAEVLHVPGHSPGHVAFWFADQRLVISGDVLFAGSIGRTDLPGGSYATLMESIRRGLLPLGDDVRVLTGHGPETTVGQEREHNPFLTGVAGL